MRSKSLIIIILLSIIIFLLVIDIFTGIWYSNRHNLQFDSGIFNNILTPILTFIATIIYGIALFTTINQNKIIISQNLKPYYERELENLIERGKNLIIYGAIPKEGDRSKRTGLDYPKLIMDSIFELKNNAEYIEDLDSYMLGSELTMEYIEKRDYYNITQFLNSFSIGFTDTTFFYIEIRRLVEEIESSKLLDIEKQLLKKRIKSELLSEYMATIKFLDNEIYDFPKIPMYSISNIKLEFKELNKTTFRKDYDWFIQHLETQF